MSRRNFFGAYTALAAALLAAPAAAQQSAVVPAGPARTEVLDRGAMDPALSPDGGRIAVSILGRLWLVPVAGGDAVQLTSGAGWDARPAWSPDGQFIAYAHATPNGTVLMELNLATGARASVQEMEGSLGQIAYHPARRGAVLRAHARPVRRAPVAPAPRRRRGAPAHAHAELARVVVRALARAADTVFVESGRYGGADLYLLALDSLRATRLTETPAPQRVLRRRGAATGARGCGSRGRTARTR